MINKRMIIINSQLKRESIWCKRVSGVQTLFEAGWCLPIDAFTDNVLEVSWHDLGSVTTGRLRLPIKRWRGHGVLGTVLRHDGKQLMEMVPYFTVYTVTESILITMKLLCNYLVINEQLHVGFLKIIWYQAITTSNRPGKYKLNNAVGRTVSFQFLFCC